MARDDPPGRLRMRLCAAALAWSLALIPGAFWFPVYHGESTTVTGANTQTIHTSATLVGVNGAWVVIPVAVPALLALAVMLSLALRHRRIAAATVIALAGFNLLAMFSIGIFVLPATALLLYAVFAAPSTPRARPAPA